MKFMRLIKSALIVSLCSSLIVYNSNCLASIGSKSSISGSHSGKKMNGRSKGKSQKAKTGPGDVWARIRLGIRIPRPGPASEGYTEVQGTTIKKTMGSSSKGSKTTDAFLFADEEIARLTTVINPKKSSKNKSQLIENTRINQVIGSKADGNEIQENENFDKKYTALGRLRFAKTGKAIPVAEKLPSNFNEKANLIQSKSLFKSPSVQRIRTRLGLHPELFKDAGSTIEQSLTKSSTTERKTSANGTSEILQASAIRNCSDLKKDEVIGLAQRGILADSYSQMAKDCRIRQNQKFERVSKFIASYSQRKGYLYQVSEQARPYLYHIVNSLTQYNLPLDLALLPIVESAYQPTAMSPKSAAGIWQFIPSTGIEYGLHQNEDYDERLDITASTQAAIRFLSGLNSHFKGDWLLALAAYNCGQGTVDAAISRNQAEGLETDYWSLDLPAETQDYVPRLLALSTIFENPANFGLNLRSVKNEPYFIKINIDREADINQLINKDLKSIAKLANFEPDQFDLLNSAYLKDSITQKKPFSLLMPIANANLLHQSLAFLARPYIVENSEQTSFSSNLAAILDSTEQKAQAPLLSISLNGGEGQDWLPSAKQIVGFNVQQNSKAPLNNQVNANSDYGVVHYLDKGETLKDVAESHGISEGELREFNKFKSRQKTSFGQRLFIPMRQITIGSAEKTNNPSVLYKETDGL
jgi:soluble lytic murein transglycosylase-like protein